MEWYLKVMKNHYADFNGRARRKEYWMFGLIYMVVILLAIFLDNVLGLKFNIEGLDIPYGYLYGLTALIHLIPSFAVTVRRFHDCDKSGWLLLLLFIPLVNLIGFFVFLYYMLKAGTSGDNRFGSDPKEIEK